MLPPLFMNYIEHILINKEKLNKKNFQDGFLTVLTFSINYLNKKKHIRMMVFPWVVVIF